MLIDGDGNNAKDHNIPTFNKYDETKSGQFVKEFLKRTPFMIYYTILEEIIQY